MMTEGSLCLYVAAVLIFTVIPIRGSNEKCKNKDFTLEDGLCYRFNPANLSWTAAKENCEKWNGQLATFGSMKKIKTECTHLGRYVWIQGIEFSEKGFQWAFGCQSEFLKHFSEACKAKFPSFCIETYEVTGSKPKVSSRSIAKRDSINEVTKGTCLGNDYVHVDKQCYRSPTEERKWKSAMAYCADRKEILANFSSMEQVIKVLKSLNLVDQSVWVQNPLENQVPCAVYLTEEGTCHQFTFGYLPEILNKRFLCMKLAIPYIETTTTPASITTRESQGKKKDGLQLVKKFGQKTRVDLNTNLYFYEK